MVATNCQELAKKLKHITTTAKLTHAYEFVHDEPGFNYRLPNLNAALGSAQLTRLEEFVIEKRNLADKYKRFFENGEYKYFSEASFVRSNYWLNAVFCENQEAKDNLLRITNEAGVMTRPAWKLMVNLKMFTGCERDELHNSKNVENRLVCLPSSVLGHKHNI